MNPTTDGTPWQEASILRLRDIDNVDITSTPSNNALLVWSTAENGWVVTDASTVVGLTDAVRRDDFSQGIRNGRVLSVRWPDTDGNPTTYPFGERPIVRGAWNGATATAYNMGDIVYDDQSNKVYRLQSDGVPTDLLNTRPSLARTDVDDQNDPFTVWELLSTDWQGTWNSLAVYDEGSIVTGSDGHVYLKLTSGQVDGAGTDPTADDDTAWQIITVDSNTTYRLQTIQGDVANDPVVITLDEIGATDDSTITLVGGDNVTLSTSGDADGTVLTIDSPDTNTTYDFSTGLTQTPDTVNDPPGPDTTPKHCLLYTSPSPRDS